MLKAHSELNSHAAELITTLKAAAPASLDVVKQSIQIPEPTASIPNVIEENEENDSDDEAPLIKDSGTQLKRWSSAVNLVQTVRTSHAKQLHALAAKLK